MKRVKTFPLFLVVALVASMQVFSDQIQPLLDVGEEI